MNLTFRPSLEEARALAADHDLVPIVVEVGADLDTTVGMMLRLGTTAPCFLFESVEGGEHVARYSFIGHDPIRTLTFRDGAVHIESTGAPPRVEPCVDPLGRVEAEVSGLRVADISEVSGVGLPFSGGAAGFLAYEAARHYERLPVAPTDPLGLPDAWFGVFTTVIAFDHVARRILLVTHIAGATDGPDDLGSAYVDGINRLTRLVDRLDEALPGGQRSLVPLDSRAATESRVPEVPTEVLQVPTEATANISREAYLRVVDRAREFILAGDIFQVNLSRRFALPLRASPFELYRWLRRVNPSPYMFFLATPSCTLAGTSPEMLVRVTGRDIEYHPIAGTRRRGRDPGHDARMEAELLASEKEAAEHLMLVDLGRNDVGRVSQIGTVKVTQFRGIERYSHVMHMVSHIEGRLRSDCTPVDALRVCFPAGTVTGAPKLRAMEIVAELEPESRGVYAGAVGYVGFNGNIDTAIALRTVVVVGDTAYVQAAGGIVADSTPHEEALEIDNKAAAAISAVDRANAAHDSSWPLPLRNRKVPDPKVSG